MFWLGVTYSKLSKQIVGLVAIASDAPAMSSHQVKDREKRRPPSDGP